MICKCRRLEQSFIIATKLSCGTSKSYAISLFSTYKICSMLSWYDFTYFKSKTQWYQMKDRQCITVLQEDDGLHCSHILNAAMSFGSYLCYSALCMRTQSHNLELLIAHHSFINSFTKICQRFWNSLIHETEKMPTT